MIKLESEGEYDSLHILCHYYAHITLVVCLAHMFHSITNKLLMV